MTIIFQDRVFYTRQNLRINEEKLKNNSKELEKWKVKKLDLDLELEMCKALGNGVFSVKEFCFNRYV